MCLRHINIGSGQIGGGQVQDRAILALDRKADQRVRHGQPRDRIHGSSRFGSGGLEKLQSCRGGVEQVVDRNGRTRLAGRGLGLAEFAPGNLKLPAMVTARLARGDGETRNGTD